MLLIFLDTETTGINPEKHRAIEIAFKIFDSSTLQIVNFYESVIIQPREIWASADPESLKITGFTYEEILKGKNEKVVESEITHYLNNAKIAEKSGVFICQNPSFDRAFFCKIVSCELQERYRWPYHWLDLASMYWAYRHFHKEDLRNIKEDILKKDHIAEKFSLPREARPHRAMNGVNHLIACYEAMFGNFQALSIPSQEHARDGGAR